MIPESGRSLGEGNGNPLQYCLRNSMDRGAWWATVLGVSKSGRRLSDYFQLHSLGVEGASKGQQREPSSKEGF